MSETPLPTSINPTRQYPAHEGEGVNFPMTAEAVEQENHELLKATIFAPDEIKQQRYARFPQAWHERWHHSKNVYDSKAYFGIDPNESPFAKYSSQGWKLHVPFKKGYEEDVSRFLYGAGLYFKTQSFSTFFRPNNESGSTVYVGSWDAMQGVAEHLRALEPVLSDGTLASMEEGQSSVHAGSGSDIEIKSEPRITARFDIQKSKHGSRGGDSKYSGYGLPSWINICGIFSALPILASDESKLYELERQTFVSKPSSSNSVFSMFDPVETEPVKEEDFQRLLDAFREAQSRAEQELVQDFGREFVLGKD